MGETLAEAGETMDPVRLFESAHAMKGVCANLGLDALSALASELAEEFHPGNARTLTDAEVQERVDALRARHEQAIQAIRAYAEEKG